MAKAYLLLENGMIFEGESFGAEGTAVGELVFTTGMTGCAESLTDPSYRGQMIVFTFPQLGNYGIADADMESGAIHARAVAVAEYCGEPSNFRCDEKVSDFMKRNGTVGICGIDTRYITRLIREKGVMNAAVTTEPPDGALRAAISGYAVSGVVAEVSTRSAYTLEPEGERRFSTALIDYGAKKSIAANLVKRGCAVTVYPWDVSAEEVLAGGHDGIMLTNGPGDPAENTVCIETLSKLMGRLPVFGICLGHQMMALSQGCKTLKMKFGHRGANQPARDVKTGRIYVTSQNHGYAVDAASLGGTGAVLRYVNVNDGSCEGLDYPGLNAFSTQFHPEAHGGPRDCEEMFDRFIDMMGGVSRA